jgi:transcriptional regulator with XRE-family HTH domain
MQAENFAVSLTPSRWPQGIICGVVYLREWRKHAGLTGDELGAMLDPPASAGTISSYETGKRRIGPQRLAQLAEALGTTQGKLLDEPPPIEGAARVVVLPGELIDMWDHFSPRAKKRAVAMLRVIADDDGEEGEADQAQR